jgi:hypothetical protein
MLSANANPGRLEGLPLTPLRIVILLVSTLVLSILGVALIVIGVHGPQVIAMIGGFLLLPSIILTRLGMPLGIPFHSVDEHHIDSCLY